MSKAGSDGKSAAPAAAAGGKPEKDKSKKKAGSDDEEVDPVEAAKLAAAELACSGCANPCTVHPSYPDGVIKKLSKGAFSGSVKQYSLHFVLCTGVSGAKWPNRIEAEPNSYAAAYYTAFESVRKQCPFSVMMTVTDEPSADVHPNDSESTTDILVFPLMLRYRNIKVGAQLAAVLKAECIDRTRATGDGIVVESMNPHASVVLVCNHKLRDDRCGRSGPMLITEFHHTLQDKKLDATLADICKPATAAASAAAATATAAAPATTSPVSGGGAVVLGTSHVGGHKYAGNVICYPSSRWYARVTPCHVHTIVDTEVLPRATTGVVAGPAIEPLLRGTVTPLPAAPTAASAAAPAAAKADGAKPTAIATTAAATKW